MKLQKFFYTLIVTVAIFGLSSSIYAQDATKPVASMTWKSTTIDLGQIEQGKPVTVEFEFTNPSMVPLIISSVRPNCGCTVADYPKEPIAPGKSGKIVVTYNAATSGAFTKSTMVNSNAADGQTSLIIKGEVIARKK